MNDALPNSSRDSKVGLGVKQWKKKKVGAHSLTCGTSGLGGHVGALGWDYDKFTSESSRWDQLAQPKKECG
jgi:hypothetical protein